VLRTATLWDLVDGRHRPPATTCPHRRCGFEAATDLEERSVFSGTIRRLSCPTCAAATNAEDKRRVLADDKCDVCLAPATTFFPAIIPVGNVVVSLDCGPCCRELLEFPPEHVVEQVTYLGIGRNEPCPCGSGDKFKRCHGRPT
jgi:hypothetical protein